jgi:hypothetical protein
MNALRASRGSVARALHSLVYARRMQDIEATVRALLAAAHTERKAKLDAGWVDTVLWRQCCFGQKSCSTPLISVSCAGARGGTASSR